MIILKFMMKLIIALIQIPLTLLYFVLNLIGGIITGAGWIIGILIFMITAVCWIFGQFDVWFQPIIGIVIAGTVAFMPALITDFGGSIILKFKKLLQTMI